MIIKTTNPRRMSVLSVTHNHTHMVGGLPGAGCGVCGSRPLLAVLLCRVVHSVTGQHGEDEVRRLGAEICLAFDLTRLSYLTKLLIIQAYRERGVSQSIQWVSNWFILDISLIFAVLL